MRELKFRRAYFNYKDDKFEGFSYWGSSCDENGIPTGFTAPSSWSNAKGKIDQQFTGLKDKNGKEIYEGDIIKWCFVNTGDLDEKEYTEAVEWSECGFFLDGGAPLTVAMDDCEVIGTIYENGHLLK